MILDLFISLQIWAFSLVDTALLAISGIERITPYFVQINTAILSFFGMLHEMAPISFATFAWMFGFWFNSYITYLSIKITLMPFLWLKRKIF